MPLFFFLSGFFTLGLLQRMTLPEFVHHRYRRVLLPLLFSIVVILPLDFYVWGVGLVLDGRASWRKLQSLKFNEEISQDLWGLSHLWYLQYLFLFSLLLAGGWLLWNRVTRNSTDRTRLTLVRIATAILPIASVGVLLLEPEVVIGFQHSWFPVPAKFVYCSLFFGGGVVLCSSPRWIEKLKRASIPMLVVSVPLAVVMIRLTHDWFRVGFEANTGRLYAATTAAFAWLTLSGLCGVFLKITRPLPASIRNLSAASFWIYLFHHPIVGLLQTLLAQTSLPAIVKFGIVTSTTMAICLVSYRVCVQNTWVGRLLTGRDLRLPRADASVEQESSQSNRMAS